MFYKTFFLIPIYKNGKNIYNRKIQINALEQTKLNLTYF